jgi:tetratricopeptide (TPR) repeat protein
VFSEHCFEQTPELVFHAKGLQPGTSYTIRIVFYERGKAIAISVRNFRVAGISSAVSGSGGVVTIQTALQIAVQHQTIGLHAQAERIYREILNQSPEHPYALHLLGVMFYQRGEAGVGAQYIEQALVSYAASIAFEGDAIAYAPIEGSRPVTENAPSPFKHRRVKSKLSSKMNREKRLGYNSTSPTNAAMAQLMRDVDNFHNSLGECYRMLGRLGEAKEQYLIALAINPELYTAHFNLGLLYQQQQMWDLAIER